MRYKIFLFSLPAKNIKIGIPRIIKWNSPLEPFIKLNINGSLLGNPGLAGAGGLLCSSGVWTSNNISELGAVR